MDRSKHRKYSLTILFVDRKSPDAQDAAARLSQLRELTMDRILEYNTAAEACLSCRPRLTAEQFDHLIALIHVSYGSDIQPPPSETVGAPF